jgi:hypothetical protein
MKIGNGPFLFSSPRLSTVDDSMPIDDIARSGPVDAQAVRARRSAESAGLDDLGGEWNAQRAALLTWVDLDKAKRYADDPILLLRAVAEHHRMAITATFERTLDLADFQDETVFDEAAVLYREVLRANGHKPPAMLIRKPFLHALAAAFAERRELDALFARPAGEPTHTPYFDGFALRNAVGMTFEDLLRAPETFGAPIFEGMNEEGRRGLLRKKFVQMAEDRQYAIGTPEHAIASALMRSAAYRGESTVSRYAGSTSLVDTFKEAESTERAQPGRYPMAPRLLAALLLARANGVDLVTFERLSAQYERAVAYAEQLRTEGNEAPARWLAERLAAATAGRTLAEVSDEAARQRAMQDVLAAVPQAALGDTALADFGAQLAKEGVTGATLVGADWQKRAAAVQQYFNDELARAAAASTGEPDGAESRSPLGDLVSMLPVIGPIYNIEEGVRHKDALQALCGVFFLGLDALFGLGEAGYAAVRVGASALARTHSVAAEFPSVARALGASVRDIGIDEQILDIGREPPDLSIRDGNVPESIRDLAVRVRSGEADVRWRGFQVVRLGNNDRIVPVEHAGGTYHEIDWMTGERVRNAPLISRDEGRFRSDGGLVGGRPNRSGVVEDDLGVSVESLGKAAMRHIDPATRSTVSTVEALLSKAKDAALRNFDTLFDTAFDYPQPAVSVSAFDGRAFYRTLYRDSPTFRRVFNLHAAQRAAGKTITQQKWQFAIGEHGPAGPHQLAYTDFQRFRIHLPADADFGKVPRYPSALGQEATPPEQAYIHEMLHALSEARDPEPKLALYHRGPIVYLTDKILSEAGYDFPEQIMYRRVDPVGELGAQETIEGQRAIATARANRENLRLDATVGGMPATIAADTRLGGVELAQRPTVAAAARLIDSERVRSESLVATHLPFGATFDREFAFAPGTPPEMVARVRAFCRRLHRASPLFRHLMDSTPKADRVLQDVWTVATEPRAADLLDAAENELVHGVDSEEKQIRLFKDGAVYLTSGGFLPVEWERKVALAFVRAMGGEALGVSAAQAARHRGADVYLAERILKSAGIHLPPQLSSTTIHRAMEQTERAAKAKVLSSVETSTRREAAIEDRYLNALRD